MRLGRGEEKKKKSMFSRIINSRSQSDPPLSELYFPFISPTSTRLTGRMNVSHGDDKNPVAVQKRRVVASLAGGNTVRTVSKKKYVPGIASKSPGNYA